jgi:hypothetical protein
MDLTDVASDDSVLNTVDSSQDNAAHEEKMDTLEALKCIDDRWYKTVAGKKARWMDLIGDYAGNERFILDGTKPLFGCRRSNKFLGESLLQHVLDDPLLALARPDGKSVCHVRCYVSVFVIYRSKLSSSARRSLDGTAFE